MISIVCMSSDASLTNNHISLTRLFFDQRSGVEITHHHADPRVCLGDSGRLVVIPEQNTELVFRVCRFQQMKDIAANVARGASTGEESAYHHDHISPHLIQENPSHDYSVSH